MNRDNQQERMLTAQYLAGFIDGEGCFSVSIHPHPTAKYGWLIDPDFTINQHQQSEEFLKSIQRFFRCGKIYAKSPGKSNVLTFTIMGKRNIAERVIPFIDQNPLHSHKQYDYEKFKAIVMALMSKDHLYRDGFIKIINLAFAMNGQGRQRKYTLQEVVQSIPQ